MNEIGGGWGGGFASEHFGEFTKILEKPVWCYYPGRQWLFPKHILRNKANADQNPGKTNRSVAS